MVTAKYSKPVPWKKISTETNPVLQVKQTAQDCFMQHGGVKHHEHTVMSEHSDTASS